MAKNEECKIIKRKIFFRWLKERNFYFQYVFYIKNYKNFAMVHNIEDVNSSSINSFRWDETEEGYRIWSALSSEWAFYYDFNLLKKYDIQ